MVRVQFAGWRRLALALGAGIAMWQPLAAGAQEIFVCTDADGRKVYQNTGSAKGCKRLDVQPLVSMPAPRLRSGNGGVTPANFPRVEADTQRMRDGERRRILEDELKTEEDKLARLRGEFNNGQPERLGDEARNFARYQERVARMEEDIRRSETNVAALRRELAMLRQ